MSNNPGDSFSKKAGELFKSNFRIVLFLSLLLHCFLFSNAQKPVDTIDSLIDLSQSPDLSDSLKINYMLEAALYMRKNNDIKLSDQSSESLIHSSRQLSLKSALEGFWLQKMDSIGVYFRNQALYHEALFWHRKELVLADSLKLDYALIRAYNNLGVVHRRMDDYRLASDYHLKAMGLADAIGDKKSYLVAISGLGNIQFMLGNYQEALRRFREGLELEQQLNDLVGVAINLNNIGNVYFKQFDFDKALEYYMLSLEVNREAGSSKGVAICYNDLGNVYKERKQFNKALNYYLLGLEINQSLGDLYYISQSNINVGALYLEIDQPEKAIPYIETGLNLSRKSNALTTYKRALDLMYLYRKEKGNYKQAIAYMEESNRINDSILNNNLRRTVIQMQTLFDRERSENQIALLQHQKELSELRMKDQRLVNVFGIASLVLLLIGLSIGIYVAHIRTQSNKLLRKQKEALEHAQSELKVYAEKLLEAKEEAEHHSKLKSQFLANMSHEIRTPMNSIIGFADILYKLIENNQHRSFLDAIRKSGQSLLMLINDILDLSKIEADKLIIDDGPLNIRNLVNDIKQLFSIQLSEKQLDFKLQIDDSLPEEVFLSEIRLRQILFNLIGNAIKFTNKGSIELRIVTSENQIDKSLFDLHIHVKDTGIGIDKTDLDRIFEAFYQNQSHAVHLKGTGLGLAITQRLVEAMNGSINVESSLGKGSTFSICFKAIKSATTDSKTQKNIHTFLNQNTSIDSDAAKMLLLTQNPVKHHLINQLAGITGFEPILIDYKNKLTEAVHNHNPTCLVIDPDGIDGALKTSLFTILRERQMQLIYTRQLSSQEQQQLPDGAVFELPDQQDLLRHFLTKLLNDFNNPFQERKKTLFTAHEESDPVFEKIRNMWIHALNSNIVGDAKKLAEECIKIAEIYHFNELEYYGKSLEEAVENFDVEQIQLMLQQFPGIIKSVNPGGK